MKKEDFFEVFGELDDDIVKGAKTTMKKKKNWKTWGTMAACFAVVIIAAPIIPRVKPAETNFHRNEAIIATENETNSHRNETVIATDNLKIYYLSESGTIESKSVELQCDPKDIFNKWAALNNIADVTFVDCVYDDNGGEKTQGEMIEHSVGNYYTLDFTVSKEFSSYAKSERGDLLIQSLRQTFCDYTPVDDFNLIIDN